MAAWQSVHKVDVTYVMGLAVAGFTVVTHEYNPAAFVFAAACLGLPSLYRWEAKRNGNGKPPSPIP